MHNFEGTIIRKNKRDEGFRCGISERAGDATAT